MVLFVFEVQYICGWMFKNSVMKYCTVCLCVCVCCASAVE